MDGFTAWPEQEQSMKTTQKPVHEVRIAHIKGAIWRNETEAGPRYNATFSRLYRNGDQWQSSDSFGRDDLLLLGKVADLAHTWIFAQTAEDNRDAASRKEG